MTGGLKAPRCRGEVLQIDVASGLWSEDFGKSSKQSFEPEAKVVERDATLAKIEEDMESDPPYSDHDYTYNYKFEDKGVKMEGGSAKAWIDEDEPPMVSHNIL